MIKLYKLLFFIYIKEVIIIKLFEIICLFNLKNIIYNVKIKIGDCLLIILGMKI